MSMESKMLTRIAAAILTTVFTCACLPQESVGVRKSESGETVFSVDGSGTSDDQKCFESVAVFNVSEANGKTVRDSGPLWEVIAHNDLGCTKNVVYGRVPNGFRGTTDRGGLRSGKTYSVVARISGGIAERSFVF